jgi:hypothetical protein
VGTCHERGSVSFALTFAALSGLDYMRWIASWNVLFFHLGGAHLFGRMKINTFNELSTFHHTTNCKPCLMPSFADCCRRYLEHRFNWMDVFNFHWLMLAVPSFMLVATFLYARKLFWMISRGERAKHMTVLKERLQVGVFAVFDSKALLTHARYNHRPCCSSRLAGSLGSSSPISSDSNSCEVIDELSMHISIIQSSLFL